MGLEYLINMGKEAGLFQYYLPFVIFFSIFYGLLVKSKIFGEQGRNISIIIALGAALYVMASPMGSQISEFLATFLPQTGVVLTTILAFGMILFLLFPILGMEQKFEVEKFGKYLIVFGGLVAFGVFITSGGFDVFISSSGLGGLNIPYIAASPEDMFILCLVLLTVFAIWWMAKGEGGAWPPENEVKQKIR